MTTNIILPNYHFVFDKKAIKDRIDYIFANDHYYQLRKRSSEEKMDLNKMLKFITYLEQGCSLRQCAKKLNINISTLTRSLQKIATLKRKARRGYGKVNLRYGVESYANFRKNIHQYGYGGIKTKGNVVLKLIQSNYLKGSKFKRLSTQLIRYQLSQIYGGKIPAASTLYNWLNSPILEHLKPFLIFKKGYRKKRKKAKEPKRPKAVFNANGKTHQDYLKIVDQPHIYQLDTITGKKFDCYGLVLLTNLQTGQPYMKTCLKNKGAVRNALKAIIRKHHLQIDHLLMDNGGENILLDQIDPNINLYHCDAASPGQKSNVERTIRDLRTYPLLTKYRSLDSVNQKEVDRIIFHYWDYRQFLHK